MREHPTYRGYFVTEDGVVTGRAGHALKPSGDGRGYFKLVMCLPGNKRKTVRVHVLVCETYHGPAPSPQHVVAHSDGDRANNRASNLRWATHSENERDKVRHGRVPHGETHRQARLTEDAVRRARTLRGEGLSYRALAEVFGVTKRTIQQAVTGETWGHVR